MERRLNASETSLDAPMRSDEQGDRTQGDFVRAAPASRPDVQVEAGEFGAILRDKLHAFGATLRDRDLEIFRDRLLNDEPATLVQIAERFGVTRERVRQIEERLKKRLRQYLESELGDARPDRRRARLSRRGLAPSAVGATPARRLRATGDQSADSSSRRSRSTVTRAVRGDLGLAGHRRRALDAAWLLVGWRRGRPVDRERELPESAKVEYSNVPMSGQFAGGQSSTRGAQSGCRRWQRHRPADATT